MTKGVNEKSEIPSARMTVNLEAGYMELDCKYSRSTFNTDAFSSPENGTFILDSKASLLMVVDGNGKYKFLIQFNYAKYIGRDDQFQFEGHTITINAGRFKWKVTVSKEDGQKFMELLTKCNFDSVSAITKSSISKQTSGSKK